jgi:ABC-2 type transport system permease protein
MTTDPSPHGRPITGPGAFGDDAQHFWRLVWTLATTSFKLRFFGSALGYLWQLMRPLMLFAVMYVIFTVILGVGDGEPLYGVALLLGIVFFQFFTDSVGVAVRSIIAREALIRKVDFPRLAVPLACVLQALFNLGLNLIVVLLFLIFTGGHLMLSWIQFPLILLMLICFSSGLAMILSAMYVRFRDVQPIWEVITQALFYGTPILYTISMVIDKAGLPAARILLMNPVASAIQQARHAMVDHSYVAVGNVYGTLAGDLIPIGISVATLIIGLLYFRAAAPHMAERL